MSKLINSEDGGLLGEAPNKKYEQFFAKFADLNTLDIKEYKPVHLIGYFCKKYKEQYNIDYKFKFNSPSPSKCFEVFQIKRAAMLLSSDPLILKEYIDWVFLTKVVAAKRRLTSISFMTAECVINEYKINVLLAGDHNKNIDRTIPLPNKYLQPFVDCQQSIRTYGDLAFLYQMDPMPKDIDEALNTIVSLGFDKSILDRII